MTQEEVMQEFMWGMASLNSYIHFNKLLNYQSINILSENFVCHLLNIIYGYNLKNANHLLENNQYGYDLIDQTKKLLIQVTSTDDPKKVSHTWDVIRKNYLPVTQSDIPEATGVIDLTGYSFMFFILRSDSHRIKDYCEKRAEDIGCPSFLSFDTEEGILDLDDLVEEANYLEPEQMEQLNQFMDRNRKMFTIIDYGSFSNRVSDIIKEYSDNYTAQMFLHTYRPESKVSLENVYVEPKYRKTETYNASRDMISLVSKFICENPSERILYIDGDAAIGKTSLISWLCYHYSHEKEEDYYLSLHKALFLGKQLVCIRLRELDFQKNNYSVEETVLSYLQIDDLKAFQKIYDDALIVLDGIDEISMVDNLSSSFIQKFVIDFRKAFKYNKLIITGRPYFLDVSELQSGLFGICHIELMHFDGEMRKEWIANYEACGEVIPVATKDYILSLEDENAVGVADTPLALYMLVSCEIREELRGNRWMLFHEIFRNAIIKTEYNENFSSSSTHPIDENAEEIYRTVCRIAYRMFQNATQEKYYITGEELDAILKDMNHTEIPDAKIRQYCVLCAYWKAASKRGALEFYHNDIRDFFFSEFIYDALKGCVVGKERDAFVSSFFAEMLTILQYGSISETTWEQTFEFLYLRLLYEAERHVGAAEKIIDAIYKNYAVLVGELLGGTALYKYDFQYNFMVTSYTRIKNVVTNILLLLNTVIDIKYAMPGTQVAELSISPSENSKKQILSSDILNNWSEMFLYKIHIPGKKSISFGKHLDLSRANLHYTDLHDSDFSCSDLSGVRFDHVNLKRGSFSHAILDGTVFSGCDLTGADFSFAIIRNAIFKDCTFIEVNFENAIIDNCGFCTSKRFSATFENAEVSVCQMDHIVFEKSIFRNAVLGRVTLTEADFSAVKEIEHLTLNNCDLKNAVFDKVNLTEVNFGRSSLINASFIGSVFRGCSLENAYLNETNFFAAEFYETTINKGSMFMCNTHQAVFDGTSSQALRF